MSIKIVDELSYDVCNTYVNAMVKTVDQQGDMPKHEAYHRLTMDTFALVDYLYEVYDLDLVGVHSILGDLLENEQYDYELDDIPQVRSETLVPVNDYDELLKIVFTNLQTLLKARVHES